MMGKPTEEERKDIMTPDIYRRPTALAEIRGDIRYASCHYPLTLDVYPGGQDSLAVYCTRMDCKMYRQYFKPPMIELVPVDAPAPEADMIKVTKVERGVQTCVKLYPLPE